MNRKDQELRRRRIWAQFIDLLTIFLLFICFLGLMTLIQQLIGLWGIDEGFLYVVKLILNYVVLITIYTLFYAYIPSFNGQTIGKLIMGIKVVPKQGRGIRTFGRMLFREMILKYLITITIIGGLYNIISFFTTSLEPIYDKVTQSEVVFVNK